ncbi:PEGA domain-containing protein [Candidatus Dojkabacteria bacterium]|nr:PEGA domain-containing protein [Candidatus Dojkabacteria bacterium]
MKRHIVVIVFVTIFISAVSIIAILVARGFTFTGTEIKENGIINVVSQPEGANITINGEETAVTPEKIEVVAGKIEVIISKEGYKEWKKEIDLEPSIVTDIYATLFPETLYLEQITFTSIDKAFFSQDGAIALYTVSNQTNSGIWLAKLEKSIFELSSPQPTRIASLSIIPENNTNTQNYDFIIAPDNTRAIVICPQEEYTLFQLLNLENSKAETININKKIGFNPASVSFSFNRNHLLIKDIAIYVNYDIEKDQVTFISRVTEEYAPQIIQSGSDLLLLEYSFDRRSRTLYKITAALNKTTVELPQEIAGESIKRMFGSKNNGDLIVISTQDSSFILDLKTNSLPIQISEGPINIVSWSPNGNSFLYTESGEVLKTASTMRLPSGKLELKTYTLLENYKPENISLSWSNNSQQVLSFDSEKMKLFIQDKDSLNRRLLYEGTLSYRDAFKFSQNETFLVLLLKDDGEYSNLYSFKLTI